MLGKVNVLIPVALSDSHVVEIATVDERLQVNRLPQELRRLFRNEPSEAPAMTAQTLKTALADTEILYSWRGSGEWLTHASNLKWIQLTSAGADYLVDTEILNSSIVITDASGVSAIPIAEHVLGFMIMFAKQMPLLLANQKEKRWERLNPIELNGKTLGVVGLGNIGQEVARRARAFGMRILAIKRTAALGRSSTTDVDELLSPHDLPYLLGASDFVALCVPLTGATTKMIGEAELRQMKPTAYLINISRGRVLNEVSLIQALKEGWIAGAGLDVFEIEPLPSESPLWELPNVIITPHQSGGSDRTDRRMLDLFCENLRLYLRGERLLNVVNKDTGY